jgi:hypothetical protein
LIIAVSTVIIVIYYFSKDKEEIAAPAISIIQPAANDTIHLTNGSVTIKVKVEDIANIKEMAMDVKTRSGITVFSDKEEAIDNQNYTCIENFYPTGIIKKTHMKLHVVFKNEFKNLKSKTIKFYVLP